MLYLWYPLIQFGFVTADWATMCHATMCRATFPCGVPTLALEKVVSSACTKPYMVQLLGIVISCYIFILFYIRNVELTVKNRVDYWVVNKSYIYICYIVFLIPIWVRKHPDLLPYWIGGGWAMLAVVIGCGCFWCWWHVVAVVMPELFFSAPTFEVRLCKIPRTVKVRMHYDAVTLWQLCVMWSKDAALVRGREVSWFLYFLTRLFSHQRAASETHQSGVQQANGSGHSLGTCL